MTPDFSERAFEDAIEVALLAGGPDARQRLSSEIAQRGVSEVLRQGTKDSGCKFKLAYFRPASGLNDETRRLHAGNIFSLARQLRYRATDPTSPDPPGASGCFDLVLFLNMPIFTAELKNSLTGHDVEDAIRQYKTTRDPREPLLKYGRCFAHFAVDPHLVYVSSHLAGPATRFLPFNRGKFGGAGNPPDGDFFVRSGNRTDKLAPESAAEFIRARFPNRSN